MSEPERLLAVWADTKKSGACRSDRCGKPITFYQTVKGGKMMPFDGDPVPRRSETEAQTGRVLLYLAFDESHFRTCIDASRFSASKTK